MKIPKRPQKYEDHAKRDWRARLKTKWEVWCWQVKAILGKDSVWWDLWWWIWTGVNLLTLVVVLCLCRCLSGSGSKESTCNSGDLGLILGSGRFPGEGNSNPLQYSCLEKSHGRRSVGAGYCPWGRKESGTTERPYFTYFMSILLRSIKPAHCLQATS